MVSSIITLRASLFFLFLLSSANVFGQDSTLIRFTMEDQFGNEYTEQSWSDSALVFFCSDRGGSKYNEVWAKTLWDSLHVSGGAKSVRFIGLSDVSGVPFFLKGFVRSKFPEDTNKWVLMDWDGVFADAYHFREDACNILIFDSGRRLIHKSWVQSMEPRKFCEILSIVRAAVE